MICDPTLVEFATVLEEDELRSDRFLDRMRGW